MTLQRLIFSRGSSRWRLVALWLLGALSVVLSLVMPREVGGLTNLFTSGRVVSWETARNAVSAMMAAQLAISLLSYVRSRLQVVTTEYMTRTLTLTLFGRAMKFSPDFFRNSEVAKINNRILDDSALVSNFLIQGAVAFPLAVLSVIFFGGVMIARNPLLGACMVPLSLLSGYYLFFDRRIQNVNRMARRTFDEIRTDANEMVSSVSEFRQHNAFEYGRDILNRRLLKYQGVMMDIGKLTAMFQAASPLVGCIQTGFLYFIGAALCIRGTMHWGDVISFLLVAQLFQTPVSNIAGFGLTWRMSRESMRRIEEILQRPCAFEPIPAAPAAPADPEISYEQASVKFESGGLILNGFTQAIGAGEHVAFCGPAGCGKTTAVSLVARNAEPFAGRVVISGKPIDAYDLDSMARTIGFVPQKPVILNMSLRNNILLGLRRKAEGAMTDEEGPVDLVGLEGIGSADDVNRRLIEVVRLVGLESDIFNKCIDLPAESMENKGNMIDRLPELGRLTRDRLKVVEGDLIGLSADRYFPGTVGENLFGPHFEQGMSLESAADILLRSGGESPYLLDLLEFGLRRLRQEHALAVRALNRATRLAEALDLHAIETEAGIGVDAREADESRLREMPRALWRLLLQSALEAEAPGDFGVPRSGDFSDRILQARKMLMEREPGVRERWARLESPGVIGALTIRENLLRARCDPRRRDALEQTDTAIAAVLEEQQQMGQTLLQGLECRAGEDGNLLSGGQKQKLAIARVLMKNPRVLLLDEATSAMDEISQRQIVDLIRSHFAGKTVLSISHRFSTIMDFDRVLMLDRGRLVESGPFEELAVKGRMLPQMLKQESAGSVHGAKDVVGREPGSAASEPEPAGPPDSGQAGDSMSEIARKLTLCPLFAGMSSDRLILLSHSAREFHFREGEMLYSQGDAGDEMFVILQGQVEVFHSDGGTKERIVARYRSGKAFGELGMFGEGVRTLSARASTDARVASLTREKMIPIMAAEPQIALALLKSLSKMIVHLDEQISQAARKG
jgi:ABC-type multidrug transport system fused ATPase/permease subunit